MFKKIKVAVLSTCTSRYILFYFVSVIRGVVQFKSHI